MRFASLGSGSAGNATVVCAGQTTLLIDCGFSGTQLERRLATLCLTVENIDAVLVTHEHGDHAGGVAHLARRAGLKPWMTYGTWSGCDSAATTRLDGWTEFSCHDPFTIGDALIEPFPVPHDAREPAQFVIGDGDRRVGLLTDAGHVSGLMVDRLRDCEALLVEFNHDREMLRTGSYPDSVIRRIDGDYGHLNNDQSADLVRAVWTGAVQQLVVGHVSARNNDPQLIQAALDRALGDDDRTRVTLADQQTPTDWLCIC